MKLIKLKKVFKNKYTIRIAAGVLTIAVVGSSACAYSVYGAKSQKDSSVNTENITDRKEVKTGLEKELEGMIKEDDTEDKDAGKEETVFVIADNLGNAKETIVSNWLKNETKSETIEDVSRLKNIKNIKGEETFLQKGEQLTWQAKGDEIYYQGTTNDKTPVTEKITYYLDDKEIRPSELAGKSGKVKIRFDYKNHEKRKITIEGKDEEIVVPFAAISGMVLNDNFTNVKVTNGKVVSDGNKNMVVGLAMPGLKESLKLEEGDFSEEVNIPDYFEVSADVKDFALDMSVTVVTSGAELGIDKSLDLSDVDEKIMDLSKAAGQLKDGSKELSKGMDTLEDSLKTFGTGMSSLEGSLSAYTNGVSQVADGIETLKNQSTTLIDGVGTIDSSADTLNAGVKALDNALNTKMTEEEKNTIGAQAEAKAAQAVKAQFADASNPNGYENLKNYAAKTFYETAVNPDTISAVMEQARAGAAQEIGSQTEQIAQSAAESARGTVAAQLSSSPQMESLRQAMIAAGVVSAAQSAGITDISVIMGDAGTMGAITENANQTVNALTDTIMQTAGTVAGETAKSVASQVAAESAAKAAGSTVEGMAAKSKDTVGDAVASAARTAANTAASGAAKEAAIAGAEATKSTIAAQIEKKDSKTGYSLVTGMDAMEQGVSQMASHMPELSTGIQTLYNGSAQLKSNNNALKGGASELVNGTKKLTTGVTDLNNGSDKLADGVLQMNEEGIEKLVNSYQGDVKLFVERIQKIVEAGKEYETFSGKADSVMGNVKFVIKTEAVITQKKQ